MIRRTARSGFLLLLSVVLTSPAASAQSNSKRGVPQDWSTRHVVYTGMTAEAASVHSDPRAVHAYASHRQGRVAANLHSRPRKRGMHVDWNFPFGSSTDNLGQDVYPAKYSFDVNAVPSCTGDYVVYPVTTASVSSANLIGLNNLYSSGVSNGGGLCDAANAGQPTVLFAYRATTLGASAILQSPAISLDGTKLAYVESSGTSGAGNALHVLAWGPGGGTVASPLTPDPTCQTSCVQSVNFGTSAYARTAFVDYVADTAYVVDGDSKVWRVDHVFNGKPVLATTDGDWPNTGFCQLSGFGPAGLVVANGTVYMSDIATALHILPISQACQETVVSFDLGFGTDIEAPLISLQGPGQGSVFVFGRDSQGNSAIYQTDLSGGNVHTLRVPGDYAVPFVGAFDNTYWNDPTGSSGFLYFVAATQQQLPQAAKVYRVGFSGSPYMNSSPDASVITFSTQSSVNTGPLLEIYNPTDATHPDKLFLLGTQECGATPFDFFGCVRSFDITGGVFDALSVVSEPPYLDVSGGMVIDNIADPNLYPQASSIYFAIQGSAIKLTQAGLQ